MGEKPQDRAAWARWAWPVIAAALLAAEPHPAAAQMAPAQATPASATEHDGQHDFDFLIGHWKAHLKKLAHPLTGSTTWIEYDGTSYTRKLWDDRANTEEFDVDSPQAHLHIHGQTLRLYNPVSHEWSLYLVYADKGALLMPPEIGKFDGREGQFYDQEAWDGREIFTRYVWNDISPTAARMVQSFSADGGRTWEANWIVDFSRERP